MKCRAREIWDANGFILSLPLPLSLQARGIDVQQVSLVINYDLPANRENYIHRYITFKRYFFLDNDI